MNICKINDFKWKKERKINRSFFKQPKKVWIMITDDPRFLRHRQFNTKTEAAMWAESVGLSDYYLVKRNKRTIKQPWAYLDRVATIGRVTICV